MSQISSDASENGLFRGKEAQKRGLVGWLAAGVGPELQK